MAQGSRATAPARSQVQRLRLADVEHVVHARPGQEWVPHWHDEWSFGAVTHGTCRCSVAGQALQLRAGDLVAIAPGEVHTGVMATPADDGGAVRIVMLHVPDAGLHARALAAPATSGRVHAPRLCAAAGRVQGEAGVEAWLRRAATRLARELGRAGDASRVPAALRPASDPAGVRLSRAESELIDRLREALLQGRFGVADLARRCGVSREWLHQVVRRWTGLAPSDYLRMVRLQQARTLLGEGLPPAEVAVACAFADQAHFTRCFRQAYGYTPGDWQRAMGD